MFSNHSRIIRTQDAVLRFDHQTSRLNRRRMTGGTAPHWLSVVFLLVAMIVGPTHNPRLPFSTNADPLTASVICSAANAENPSDNGSTDPDQSDHHHSQCDCCLSGCNPFPLALAVESPILPGIAPSDAVIVPQHGLPHHGPDLTEHPARAPPLLA